MLEVNNLSFAFGNKQIFDDLSLTFHSGTVTGIVGKNGVGKTTLFRIMTRIYGLQKGEILWNGKRLVPADITFMPTEPYFYPYMKGHEYLKIVSPTQSELHVSQKYANALDLPLHELVDNYSTGMRKKLAFAALFALNKPVIILDEPYNGVDLEGNEMLKHIINSNHGNKTIILSSHILSTITDVSDAIYYIDEQSIFYSYPKDQFDILGQEIQKNTSKKMSQLY